MRPQPIKGLIPLFVSSSQIDYCNEDENKITTKFSDPFFITINISSPETITKLNKKKFKAEFDIKISNLNSENIDEKSLFSKIQYLIECFYTIEGRQKVIDTLQFPRKMRILSLLDSTPLAITTIEIDGDIVLMINDQETLHWKSELFEIHQIAVNYGLNMWRNRVRIIKQVIMFGSRLYRLMFTATAISVMSSGFVWRYYKPWIAFPLVTSLVSVFSTLSLRKFKDKYF